MSGKAATVKQVANLLDLTPRRVQQLVADGTLPQPAARGRYDLVGCAHAYIRWLRKQAESAQQRPDTERADWLTRKTAAQARLSELEVAEKEGSLIPLDVHEQRVTLLCERLAAVVKGLGRYMGDVQRAMTDVEAAALLERIQEDLLRALMGTADEDDDGGAAE